MLARYLMAVSNGIAVQASGGAGRDDLHRIADAALRCKNKVEMDRLQTVLETIGCGDVGTYINTGNVAFTNDRNATRLRTPIPCGNSPA